MRTFSIEKLPKYIKDKIQDITFEDDLCDGCIGIVNLKDGYVFYDESSHISAFRSRKDLIDLILNEVEEEKWTKKN